MPIKETANGLFMDFTMEIPNSLHARPSALLAQEARKFASDLRLKSEHGEADLKSMLDILSLAPEAHAHLQLVANGPDARSALTHLGEFLNTLFVHGQSDT